MDEEIRQLLDPEAYGKSESGNLRARIVYLYRENGSDEEGDDEQLKNLLELQDKVEQGLGPVEVSVANLEASRDCLVKAVAERQSAQLGEGIVDRSSFILINKYGDIWFQDRSFFEVFGQAIHLYDAFFQGPKVLNSLDHLLLEQGEHGHGKTHLVTYIGERDPSTGKYDPDLVFATKQFRKLNQKTP